MTSHLFWPLYSSEIHFHIAKVKDPRFLLDAGIFKVNQQVWEMCFQSKTRKFHELQFIAKQRRIVRGYEMNKENNIYACNT